jgi:hypothetical protein
MGFLLHPSCEQIVVFTMINRFVGCELGERGEKLRGRKIHERGEKLRGRKKNLSFQRLGGYVE